MTKETLIKAYNLDDEIENLKDLVNVLNHVKSSSRITCENFAARISSKTASMLAERVNEQIRILTKEFEEM